MKTLLLQSGCITRSSSLTAFESRIGMTSRNASECDYDTDDTDVFVSRVNAKSESTIEETATTLACSNAQNSSLAKSQAKESASTSSYPSQYSSTCKNCECSHTEPPQVSPKLPSTTSDIFHDIGVEHEESVDNAVTQLSDCENETSLLLSKERENSSLVSATVEEGGSDQLHDSARYFEMR